MSPNVEPWCVVAEGSFAKASDRLGIGRSAVSRGIQKLETQLGARLLSRTTRSLALTREGEIFHARCHPGVTHISQALEDLRDLREGPPRGSLRICATVGFGGKVIAPLLWDFHAKYPDIELDLLLSDAQTDFTSGRIDVSLRNGRMEDSQIIARQIVPMQMLVCALGAKFTRARPPVRVLAAREYANKGDALRAEFQLKAQPRAEKLAFFEAMA